MEDKASQIVCPSSPDRPQLPSQPKTFLFTFFSTILIFPPLEMNVFGLKTFKKVYVGNSKDINDDRRVKLDRVKSDKGFDLKRV